MTTLQMAKVVRVQTDAGKLEFPISVEDKGTQARMKTRFSDQRLSWRRPLPHPPGIVSLHEDLNLKAWCEAAPRVDRA
jgi:hypothetical protein